MPDTTPKSSPSLPLNTYFMLFEKMADPVMLFKDDCFINCNEATLKHLGYPDKTTFLNHTPWDISPEFQADGLSSKEKSLTMNAIALQQGHHRFDWLHQCYDGEIIDVEVTLTTLYIDNELLIHVAWRDITQRKNIENEVSAGLLRWKFALEGNGDGVWDWNIETNQAIYSTRWKSMLGYSEQDIQPTNQEWQARIHPEDQAMVAGSMQAYLEGRSIIYKVEYRLKCKDDSYKWILGRGMVVSRDQQGLPLRMIGTHTDIATLKDAEQLLNRQKVAAEFDAKIKNLALINQTKNMDEKVTQQVAELTEDLKNSTAKAKEEVLLKSQFLSNMSHEIRTPINAIMSLAFLTQQTDLTAQQKSYLSEINSSAKWLLGILDNILSFSKLEAGKIELEQQNFELDSVISLLKTLTTPLLTNKEVKIIFEIEPSVPAILIGDSLRLGQVLLNLMSNAIKFTHTGSVTLKIQLLGLVAQQAYLKFSVIDTGIGLDMSHKNKLFEAFNQADNSTTRLYGGTGLGLSISKSLVSAMDGLISVDSQKDVGSCFSFRITLAIATPDTVATLPITSLKHDVKFPGLLNARILVVEDNPVIQKLIPAILGYEGMLVDLAKNGTEALALLEDNDYAAVLMDCQMPIMDGFETTKLIRMNPRFDTLPIIAMTGNAEEEDQLRCFNAGMNEFISKPVDWEKAFLTLDQWINNPAR
jgi:PAS domain S-box-containing protein